jgi:hypothetical protein
MPRAEARTSASFVWGGTDIDRSYPSHRLDGTDVLRRLLPHGNKEIR